jgi:hypothetical protein
MNRPGRQNRCDIFVFPEFFQHQGIKIFLRDNVGVGYQEKIGVGIFDAQIGGFCIPGVGGEFNDIHVIFESIDDLQGIICRMIIHYDNLFEFDSLVDQGMQIFFQEFFRIITNDDNRYIHWLLISKGLADVLV